MILEIQRFADIAPTGLVHKTVCDVSIEGFELPQVKPYWSWLIMMFILNFMAQGTLVMANLSACHRDPRF